MATELGSVWTGLNRALLAQLYPVSNAGEMDGGGPIVIAPISDGQIEVAANWHSPFESAGAESKAPGLMGLLQSGALDFYLQSLGLGEKAQAQAKGMQSNQSGALTSMQGRHGMTKMNSTQLYAGAPPVKIQLSLLFRARREPAKEVREPIDQLTKWALSKSLAEDGALVTAGKRLMNGEVIKALLPSESPQMVGMTFGGMGMRPMVIESVSHPLNGPRSSTGELISAQVQIQLSSLTALDAEDWNRVRSGNPIRLFNNGT